MRQTTLALMDHTLGFTLPIPMGNLYSGIQILNGKMLLKWQLPANRMLRKWAVELSKLLSIHANSQLLHQELSQRQKDCTEPKGNEHQKKNQENGPKWCVGKHWITECVSVWDGYRLWLRLSIVSGHGKCKCHMEIHFELWLLCNYFMMRQNRG